MKNSAPRSMPSERRKARVDPARVPVPSLRHTASHSEDAPDPGIAGDDRLNLPTEQHLIRRRRAIHQGQTSDLSHLIDSPHDAHKRSHPDSAADQNDGSSLVRRVCEVAAQTDLYHVASSGVVVKPVRHRMVAAVVFDGEPDRGLIGGRRRYRVSANSLGALDGHEQVHPLTGAEPDLPTSKVQSERLHRRRLKRDASNGRRDSHNQASETGSGCCGITPDAGLRSLWGRWGCRGL